MNYDYIIIGAGSAGCVLANRLSKDASCNVLLLEAGAKPTAMSKVPGAYSLLHRSPMDWGFYTEPQINLNNRRLYIPRGKALGGSSSTNAMAYVRGNAKDFDAWESAGNKGWGYSQVLAYFKKSENHERYENAYHQKGGPLNVSFAQYPSELVKVFLDACSETGMPYNEDYNGAEQLGASMLQFTIKNNARHSTYAAFLKPVLHRPNLTVHTGAYVKNIIIEGGAALGVELENSEKIRCNKEVLLCAGAIQSPQILLLSGIGDKSALAAHGITCKVELSGVGQNLHDHLFVPVSALCTVRCANHYLKFGRSIPELLRYKLFKTGSFTNSPIQANAFFMTQSGLDVPDAQFHFAPLHLGEDPSADPYDIKTLTHANGFSVAPILLHGDSRGYVGLRSANPKDPPLIQPKFMSAAGDVETMRKAVRKALEVANAPAFKRYAPGGTYSLKLHASDDEIDSFVRSVVETLYHPVGTCKMGTDKLAVVDPALRVHGVERLRVIDASIMPTIVSGNTNAATIMIAEKGADLVRS